MVAVGYDSLKNGLPALELSKTLKFCVLRVGWNKGRKEAAEGEERDEGELDSLAS